MLSPVRDIRISLGRSAENITKISKKMMTTMGEWELLDITSTKHTLGNDDETRIDDLAFHVG